MSDLMIGRNNNANLKKAPLNISKFPAAQLTNNNADTGSKEIMEEYVFNNTGNDAAFFDLDKINSDYEAVDNYFALNGIDVDKSQVDYANIKTIVNPSDKRTITVVPLKSEEGYKSFGFYEDGKLESINYSSCSFYFDDDGTLKTMFTDFECQYLTESGSSMMSVGNYESDLAKYMHGQIIGVKINNKGNIVLNFSDGKWIEGENDVHEVNLDELDSPIDYVASRNFHFKDNENVEEIKKITEGRFYVNFFPDDGIFAEKNSDTGEYGASQMAFRKNLLDDPIVLELIKNNSHNDLGSAFTFDDYAVTIEKYPEVYSFINDALWMCGCGFAAYANTILDFYAGHEEMFYDDFGFPMYKITDDGKKDYNYEYLMLSIFLKGYNVTSLKNQLKHSSSDYIMSRIFFNYKDDARVYNIDSGRPKDFWGYYGIKAINGIGTFDCNFNEYDNFDFKVYLYTVKDYSELFTNKESGIMWDWISEYRGKEYTGNYTGILSDEMKEKVFNYYALIGTFGFALYTKDWELQYLDTADDRVGHTMLVTGYTSDDDYIVSSWGEEFILKRDGIIAADFALIDYDENYFNDDWTSDKNTWHSIFYPHKY